MPSFAEYSEQLDKALKDVAFKKQILDEATGIVNTASQDYQQSLEIARNLRDEVANLLNESLPGGPGSRVRVS